LQWQVSRHQARLPTPVRRRTRHLKNEHRMGRNHLAGSRGDVANAVLAAAGYNFRLLFLWISILCAWSSAMIYGNQEPSNAIQSR
jgi:hypothetical protein